MIFIINNRMRKSVWFDRLNIIFSVLLCNYIEPDDSSVSLVHYLLQYATRRVLKW